MINDRNVRYLAVLSLVALFFGGVGVGFAVSTMFFRQEPHRPPPRGRPDVQELLDRFAGELGLSAEQKQAVHEIMEEGRKASEQIMREAQPKLAAVKKSLVDKIRAILTPEQRELHRKLLERGRGLPGKGPGHKPPPHAGPRGCPPGCPPGGPPPPPPMPQNQP